MSRRSGSIKPRVRRAEICDLVARQGKVEVEQLAAHFQASPETIRKDLARLDQEGRLRKFHGGAGPVQPREEGRFAQRMRQNEVAKRRIAEKLAARISGPHTLFMDTGSTTLICAEALAGKKGLTIITNSAKIADVFAHGRGGARVYLLGGLYRGDNAQTVGASVVRHIGLYHADMAILTVGALDVGGFYNFSAQEAEVARAMISAAGAVVIVADASKFNHTAPFRLAPLAAADALIADQAPDTALMAALDDGGVELG